MNSAFQRLSLMVRRSLRQHALSTTVTVLSSALATGLVMAVFAINAQAYRSFAGGNLGFDAVLGARGSQLQLVLNTVFHLETSPGNIPWALYQSIKEDPRVALAVPYAVGDNYFGFRIVGTIPEIFSSVEFKPGSHLELQAGGRVFTMEANEGVIGSYVAQKMGLKLGDIFQPYHGINFDENLKHDDDYKVVGILKPSNTPSDRVVWIPIEGMYRMTGHVLRGRGREYTPAQGQPIPEADREVSAVMLKLRSPQAGFSLDQTINKQGKVATLAWPITMVMADLFDRLGWAYRVLALVGYLVMLVAAGSLFASLHNTLNERRRDFAILRALGARRRDLSAWMVAEASFIALLGGGLGWLAYAAILGLAAHVIRVQTGVVLDVFSFHPVLVLAPLSMTLMGALAGLVPAWKAYRSDVASNLDPLS
jgi:putative ABC transport system permease protein